MKKIKELQKRSSLGEGRNYGIGFSVLNKIGNEFETYLPFTACRDYLNDFAYVESTKTEIGRIHGYDHKVLNCFVNKKYFYLGVNTLNYKDGGLWGKKEEAKNILINNYKNLEKFLNDIENNLKFKSRTTIEIDEDTLIFKVPIYWSKSSPLISIYTLLIRCYFNISNDFILNQENLQTHKPFVDPDKYFINTCVKYFNNINLKYESPDYIKYNIKSTDKYSVHNFGIQSFLNKIT